MCTVIGAQEQGPFCGAVGSEGCNAIRFDSSAVVGWATGCTVVRGPVDIVDPDGPRVRFGTEAAGIGPAGTSTTSAVSLGDGGTATLTFSQPITNVEGPDFAVFENSFNDVFLELAFVEVSSDGERFVRFPATSLTPIDEQVGTYGTVDPTYINNLAGKYRVAYGTPFDLEELRDSADIDINNITHVRIVDVVGTIDPQYATRDAHGNIVNDPYPTRDTMYASGGFDLTGVAIIRCTTEGIDGAEPVNIGVWPNPASDILTITASGNTDITLTDISGRLVTTMSLTAGTTALGIAHLPAGVYLIHSEGAVYKVIKL